MDGRLEWALIWLNQLMDCAGIASLLKLENKNYQPNYVTGFLNEFSMVSIYDPNRRRWADL